jgi:hypothetical protein
MRPLPRHVPSGPRRSRGTGVFLALAALLATVAAVLPGTAGFVVLGFAVAALAVSGGCALRAQWRAILAEDAALHPAAVTDPSALTDRLLRLREMHVAQVDAALDDVRPDLARALTDAYTDAALRAIVEETAAPAPRP